MKNIENKGGGRRVQDGEHKKKKRKKNIENNANKENESFVVF